MPRAPHVGRGVGRGLGRGLLGPLGLLLPVLASGCPGPDPTDAGPVGDMPMACNANGATVVMGNGIDGTLAGFRRLVGNDNVYLIAGPQGGQHIWTALRASGIDPTQPRVQLQAVRVTDGLVLGLIRLRLPMSLAPEDPSQYGLPSQQLTLDDDKYCSVLPGDVRIILDFNDFHGHCVHQESVVHVTGFDPAGNPLDRMGRVACCTQHYPRCYPNGGWDAGMSDTGVSFTDASVGTGMDGG